jgi:tryptophanyl-tRNA synthetase
LIDDPEIIRLKVQKAKTDSVGKVKYDAHRPELQNLLSIYATLEGVSVHKVDKLFSDDNMASFKTKLANKIIDRICPIGENATRMCINQEDWLLEVLDQGAQQASQVAY